MRIRIEATDLPGRTFAPGLASEACTDVHVGVQRKDRPGELLNLVSGDAERAEWTLECKTVTTAAGAVELAGPYIQNRLGGRFTYLSWAAADGAGGLRMFRRAKIMLDAVGQDTTAAAQQSGLLVGRLCLTNAKGGPLCASVRPPLITWTASPAE